MRVRSLQASAGGVSDSKHSAGAGALTAVVCAAMHVSGAESMVVSPKHPVEARGWPVLADVLHSGTLERGAIAGSEFRHDERVSGRPPPTPPLVRTRREPHLRDRDRHLAAVARSLGWARESAARGDYADALGWVQVVEAIGDPIPHEYQTKRQAWLAALAESRTR